MTVRVLLFAVLRDRAGVSQFDLELSEGSTVAFAAESVFRQYPALRDWARSLAYAVNRSYSRPGATLNDGDELALIPPVSGG